MSLYDEYTEGKNNEKTKKLKKKIIIAIVLVSILIIALIVVILLSMQQPNKLSVVLNGAKNNDILQLLNIKEDNLGNIEIYVPIKEVAQYLGYTAYNGSYTTVSEDTNSCNVRNEKEVAIFQLDSNILRKKELSNTGNNTNNTNYQVYNLDEKVFKEDDILYTTLDGIQKAYNATVIYDDKNNIIDIYTLDKYIEDLTAEGEQGETQIQKYGYGKLDEKFANQKAIIDGMLVVATETQQYGVIDLNTGKTILGTQYDSLTYIPQNSAFLIESNGKFGIISSEGETKIKPAYDSLELIDSEKELYLVSASSKLYGVINVAGKEIVNIEYNKIGVDAGNFAENDITNGYILQDKLIPVCQGEKWGFFDIDGNKVTDLIYDGVGCVTNNKQGACFNLLQIPDYNTVIVKKNEKYGGMLLDGTECIAPVFDDAYMQYSVGKVNYYMSRVNNGKTESGDVVEYLKSRGINNDNKK